MRSRFVELQGALIDPDMVEGIIPNTDSRSRDLFIIQMVSGHRIWTDLQQTQILDILYPPPPEREAYQQPEAEYLVVSPYVEATVECPRCHVIQGYLCRTPTGNLATYPHLERQEAYKALPR